LDFELDQRNKPLARYRRSAEPPGRWATTVPANS
jgi:hypothetical protein